MLITQARILLFESTSCKKCHQDGMRGRNFAPSLGDLLAKIASGKLDRKALLAATDPWPARASARGFSTETHDVSERTIAAVAETTWPRDDATSVFRGQTHDKE